jgi:putative Mg2+ transporter-C (MgtC) family protein
MGWRCPSAGTGKEERSAGLRTFPLVAMAACGFVMIATEVPGATSE